VVSGNFLEGKNEIHNVHAKYFKNISYLKSIIKLFSSVIIFIYMDTSKLYYPIGKETLAPYSVI
jgi:hypothetical protein